MAEQAAEGWPLMRKAWFVAVFLVCTVALAAMILRVVHQDRRITVLEKQNAVLAQRAARWEDIAMRFERLNRECLQVTFGSGGTR